MPDGSVTECYAKTIAERIARNSYVHGFEHHYWRPHALRDPLRLKDSAGIFVGSMADLFGHWVPREQIDQVLEVMSDAHWHTFQTLSKYPLHLPEFDFPPNVWVGVSLPAGHQMSATGAARALSAYLRHMEEIDASVRFLSIEPLWFDAAPVFERFERNGCPGAMDEQELLDDAPCALGLNGPSSAPRQTAGAFLPVNCSLTALHMASLQMTMAPGCLDANKKKYASLTVSAGAPAWTASLLELLDMQGDPFCSSLLQGQSGELGRVARGVSCVLAGVFLINVISTSWSGTISV